MKEKKFMCHKNWRTQELVFKMCKIIKYNNYCVTNGVTFMNKKLILFLF